MPARQRQPMLAAIAQGVKFCAGSSPVRRVLGRGFAFGFVAVSYLALVPVLVREQLGGSEVDFGLLLGAYGIGSILTALWVAPARRRWGSDRVVGTAQAAFALALIPIAGASSMPLAFACAMIAGGATTLTVDTRQWAAALEEEGVEATRPLRARDRLALQPPHPEPQCRASPRTSPARAAPADAPIPRRGLVHFRLLSAQFRSLVGAAVMMLFSNRWTIIGGNVATRAAAQAAPTRAPRARMASAVGTSRTRGDASVPLLGRQKVHDDAARAVHVDRRRVERGDLQEAESGGDRRRHRLLALRGRPPTDPDERMNAQQREIFGVEADHAFVCCARGDQYL